MSNRDRRRLHFRGKRNAASTEKVQLLRAYKTSNLPMGTEVALTSGTPALKLVPEPSEG